VIKKLIVHEMLRQKVFIMKPNTLLFASILCALVASDASAIERGELLADTCVSCHAGVNDKASIPNLSYYPASMIVSQMKAFRDGSRQATVMNRHAKGYSDEDIAQLAKYIGIQGQ
jgi:sulfide dehydrogenase cytochrome subunit